MYIFKLVLYHSETKKNGLKWNFQDKVLKIISYIGKVFSVPYEVVNLKIFILLVTKIVLPL